VTLSDAKARGLSLTEVLALHHVPDDGLVFEESLDPAWVDQNLGIDKGLTAFFCQPGPTARLEVQPMGPMASRPPILVRGRTSASLRSTCVRCLAEVVLSLTVKIEQMLFSKTGEEAEDDDAVTTEELDEGAYSNEGIDLPNVLREAILLELAMNPTCEDETACDARTKALIDDVNAKNRPAVDPRWAVLEELMKKPS
jgi:uncharacterized metal-binding protein YceD (DUF177 family)